MPKAGTLQSSGDLQKVPKTHVGGCWSVLFSEHRELNMSKLTKNVDLRSRDQYNVGVNGSVACIVHMSDRMTG